MQGEDEARFETICREVVAQLGLWLYDFEAAAGRQGGVMRVYVDRHEGGAPGTGVTIDECGAVSDALWVRLEADEADGGPTWSDFGLEVSSPGIERVLRTAEHFVWARGRKVRVELAAPAEGQPGELRGLVSELEGEVLRLQVEPAPKNWKKGQRRAVAPGESWVVFEVPLGQIRRAHIVYEDL